MVEITNVNTLFAQCIWDLEKTNKQNYYTNLFLRF